jgi:hypothetical protein
MLTNKFLSKIAAKYITADTNLDHPLNHKFDELNLNVVAAIEEMLEFLKTNKEDLNQNVFTKMGVEQVAGRFQECLDKVENL